MEMIGEKSIVRDRPIYLQFFDRRDVYNSFWYVIEERDDDGIEEEEEEIHDKSDDRKKKNNNISVLKPKASETDKIRELKVPRINHPLNSLIVFNSRLYIIGGYKCPDKCPDYDYDSLEEGVSRNVFYFDTKNPMEGWLEGPTLNVHRYDQAVAALENSGSAIFVAFGVGRDTITEPFAEFLDDSLNGKWWNSLPIPAPEILKLKLHNVRLLAVTDTKVYIHCLGGYDRVGKGLSYDIQTSEWNVFDNNFHGRWYPGVVLDFNRNSYLFLFNSIKSKSAKEFCVYDLKNCTWLPSVEGLTNDGSVLPTYDDVISRKYLLRMNQENKLALVWSKKDILCGSCEIQTTVHCTKFDILCDFDSNSQLPIFRANVVSFGSFDVDGRLNNCAASLIGEDKKKFGLSKERMEI